MKGISIIADRLFDFKFKAVQTKPGEVWHDDIIKLEVYQHGQVIAYIYCDLFYRPDKSTSPCHYTITCSRKLSENSYQIPILTIGMPLEYFSKSGPKKLAYDEAKTLFHEFGHILHSIAGRTDFQHVSGTRVATDIAEVPSTLNELFFNDDRVVQLWAKDENNNPIPLDLWHKFSKNTHKSRTWSFSELDTLCKRSLWDQKVHGGATDRQMSPLEHEVNIYGLEKSPEGVAQFLRFGHIQQYDAKFYAYQISAAIFSGWLKNFPEPPNFWDKNMLRTNF